MQAPKIQGNSHFFASILGAVFAGIKTHNGVRAWPWIKS